MYRPFPAFTKAYHSFVKLKTKNENLCDFQKVWFMPCSKIFRYRFHSRECFVGKGKPTEGSREGAKCLQSCHRQHDTFKTDFHSAQKSLAILGLSIKSKVDRNCAPSWIFKLFIFHGSFLPHLVIAHVVSAAIKSGLYCRDHHKGHHKILYIALAVDAIYGWCVFMTCATMY